MIKYNLIRDHKVVAGCEEVITVAKAKSWLRVSFSDDDALIGDIISAVRLKMEKITALSFGSKTMEALVDVLSPNEFIELPYGPVTFVNKVVERVSAGKYETSNGYEVFGVSDLLIKINSAGIYKVTYQGGFDELPADLENDMKVLVAWYYENRGHVMEGEQKNSAEFPGEMTLNAYKYKKVVI